MLGWLESTWTDLHHGLRSMRRNPEFSTAGVLAMALGIGASAAMFSAVDRVLFRSLPYPDEARLVSVGIMAPLDSNEFLLAGNYLDLRRDPGPLSEVSAFQAGSIGCDLTEQAPLRLNCLRVESNFLTLLGLPPAAGRPFTAEEDRPNGPRVAIISYALWRSRFGGDPRVTGRVLSIDGIPTAVVGVLPADFLVPTLTPADILLPLALDSSREGSGRALRAFGRLKPGMPLETARAALSPYLARTLETVPPRFRKEVTLRLRPVRDRQLGDARLASLTLLGAVLAVLLIACANLANLLLARGATRSQEMAIRAALGASRVRLLRQLFAEGALLGIVGGVLGGAFAFALLRVFQTLGPGSLPRLEDASLDLRALAFAVAIAILSGIAASIPAALRHARTGDLRGARVTGRGSAWLRGGLVASQIAISLALLAGAQMLLRTLRNLESVPLGLESSRVVTASFSLGRQRYIESARQLAFFAELERKLGSIPGAQAAGISDSLPPSGGTRARPYSTIEIEGQPPAPEGSGGMVAWRYVTPGYFDALGIPILRGRSFNDADRAPAVYSMVLSQSLARRMFPGADPIGRRILRGPRGEWFTVVGVAADVSNRGPAGETGPEFYLVRKTVADLTWQNQEPPMGWRQAYAIVRTTLDPRVAASELRRVLAEMDATLPVEVSSMQARIQSVNGRPRFYAVLVGAFAGIGVLLAAIGLFGTMSFLVAQRRREIGIHMALGASAAGVSRQVLSVAGRWTLVGIAFGAPGSVILSRPLRSLLFRVDPNDLRALAGPAALLALVALAAAVVPAWRAARLDPASTLREE